MSASRLVLLFKIFLGLTALGVAGAVVGTAVLATYVIRVTGDLPGIEELSDYEPPVMTRVHAGDGRLIAEYANQSRVFVPIENIPETVVAAYVSAEDKNYFIHNGFDPWGFVRGAARSVFNQIRGAGGLQSGSTITQQVAKNFLLSSDQTIRRKVREIVLAMRIERVFSKDDILELYLNEIYLGRRAYGTAAASLLYFGKSLDELSLSETAYLAALPKAPSRLDITHARNKAYAISRRNYVLGRMAVNGYITEAERDAAAKEDLVAAERLSGSTYTAAAYFVEEVRREVFSMYGQEELYDGGLSVRTTLDTELQVAARDALRRGLENYDRRHGYRGPLTRIELGEGWLERFAATETPSDIAPWSKAVVLDMEEAGPVRIGFLDGSEGVIPFTPPAMTGDGVVIYAGEEDGVALGDTPLAWARPINEEGDAARLLNQPSDILAPGDVILVEALAGGDASAVAPADADADAVPAPPAQTPFYALRQIPEVEGAIMAMDPHTGRVLAMVGGYSFARSQYNRATQARRQPGSAFKPFVYAAALDLTDARGDHIYTPAHQVLDGAYVSTGGRDGTFYKPSNYEGRWYGLQTLRVGIERSRNTMTVRLANEIGLPRVSSYGERFGIYDNLPPFEAMALGAGETTLQRLVSAYAMLVNGGKRVTPTILDRVQDRDGLTIFRREERECDAACFTGEWNQALPPVLPDPRPDVIDPVTAFQMVHIMEGVTQRGTARTIGGKLRDSFDADIAIAGKTGTTNEYRDAWFVGFSPDLVVGVFVGFDSPRPMGTIPEGEGGGKVAAPIFQYFMAEALPRYDVIPFRIPPGVSFQRIDTRSGLLAKPGAETPYRVGSCQVVPIVEAFHPGTEPTERACIGDRSSAQDGVSVGRAPSPQRSLRDLYQRLSGGQPTEPQDEEDDDEDLDPLY